MVIGNNHMERIAHPAEHAEEFFIRRLVFAGRKQATDDVVREVVNAVDEGDLFGVPAHLHIFCVHDADAAEARAVVGSELIGIWERAQFGDDARIGLCRRVPESIREFSDWHPVKIWHPQHRRLCGVIHGEPVPRSTPISIHPAARSLLLRTYISAGCTPRILSFFSSYIPL